MMARGVSDIISPSRPDPSSCQNSMVDPLFWRGSAVPPRVNGFPETIYDDLLLWDDGNSVSQDEEMRDDQS